MSKKKKKKAEQIPLTPYQKAFIVAASLYVMTFLTSDFDRLPTALETIQFTLHIISRAADLIRIILEILCLIFNTTPQTQ